MDDERFVRLCARDVYRAHCTVSVDDLVGYGWIGLLEARLRYEPYRGVGFYSFAKQRVRGAMLDALRREWCIGGVLDDEQVVDEHTPETLLARRDVAEALGRLPSRYRNAVEAIYQLNGYASGAQLARDEGVPRCTISRRAQVGIEMLRGDVASKR